MDLKTFNTTALDIMRRADHLTLTTVGADPYPHVRALFNLRNEKQFPTLAAYQADKGLAVFLGTNTSSVKVHDAGAHPWVTVYYALPGEICGLALSGTVAPDEEAAKALWINGWEMYYPLGVTDPDYTMLKMIPVRARGWKDAQPFDFKL